MGEYAQYNGEEIKIGTCEDMLYLRADQAHLVKPLPGNVDPVRDRDGIRFRFPFPDEDGKAPGDFDDCDRGQTLWGVKVPEGVDHYTVQFKASNGYLVSLPCPEGPQPEGQPYKIHRNGYGGSVKLVQQRYWEGRLVAVCQCKGCGAAYRLPDLEDAQPIIDELHREADRESRTAQQNDTPGNEAIAQRLRTIADRVAAGYAVATRYRVEFAATARSAWDGVA